MSRGTCTCTAPAARGNDGPGRGRAKVTEEFELASGKTASEEVRRQDILLFRAPLPEGAPEAAPGETVLHAALPVTPSRTFAAAAELVQGKVHVDVLAGRERVRGKTGGNKELTLQSGGATLSVPAASLAEDTVVDVQESALSSFLPAAADLQPLAELVLDFTGATLGTSAGLSVACNEGTCPCAAGCAGDTLLVARVERVLGIPRLLVVALAEANGGRIAAVPIAGLPGIKEGGRYVFYRLTGPVGWVSGATTLASTGAAVGGAIVESNSLPLIGRSRIDAPYLLVVRPGTAQVSATVPGTRLVASGSTSVVAGGPAAAGPLPLAFAGAATTATVTPADGTLGVQVSVQVEVEATAALDPSATNLARAKLFKGTEPVEVRLLLSTSGQRLAIVPLKPLEVSTDYTFTAAGLRDAENEDVIVPSPVSFRTKDFVAPVYDLEAIVFSYPEDGITKVTAPAGSLPPFAEVLILNSSNGAVLWLQVDNDGCIGCLVGSNELPATIDDRLLVTITDPQGNVTTFERSKFVKADGTVAIGPGGGTVEGPGGVELRIPSGALEQGVELKVEGLTAEALLQQFPGQVPDLGKNDLGEPLAHMAGGIKITSKDEPVFTKPIDLAFPLPDFTQVPEAQRPPPDEPEDAYFYVVRRLEGPCTDGSDTCAASERQVLFQTIDHAFAECPQGQTTCEASEKKVVTASWPFGGYIDSIGGFIAAGSNFIMQSAASAYSYLMWTYDETLPGKALAGVVTGKVLRTKWNPGATVPQYEGVKGALVTAVDDSGQRLLTGSEKAAVTREDGSFTLWDPRYVGGTVRVAATLPGVAGDVTTLCPPGEGGEASFRCGVAYEADPADWNTSGLRFHRNIATVNLTFPAVEPPPPPPAIGVTVYRTVEEKRVDTRGIVPAGTPLILGVKPSSKAVEVREVLVQGVVESFRADPLKGQPTGADWIVEYTPGTVGTYRVEVTGLGAKESGLPEAVKGGTTFRVIGAVGTDEIVEGARPEVIPARTAPKNGATGVSISTYVQVVFTEPVRKVSGNVVLRKVLSSTTPPALSAPIAVKLSGVLRFGGVVEDLAASPDAVVTSLTVQPLSGLEYGATYRLDLGDGIEDLDTTPRGLVPYDTQFTTFSLESLSQNPESFGSPGIVVLGERAYLVQNHFYAGTLRVFETTDPVTPLEIPNSDADSRDPRYTVSYRPVDLVGESDSPLTGGRVVAVVTGPTAKSFPSNVWVLDTNDDAVTRWVGAVSLTNSAAEGFVSRSFMRAGVLYAATFRKGIQVVDLGPVKDAFKPVETDATGHFQMRQAFLTDGQGYGQEHVVSIPVNSPFGGPAHLNDIEAALVQTTVGSELVVAAAGDPGLTVVNPATQSVLWNDKVTYEREVGGQTVVEATLRYGQAIALGNVAGQDLAVVVGSGTILQETQNRPLLMVVSLFDPSNPVGLGYVTLEDATVGDVILKDDLALLGGSKQVTLVSLTDKTRPNVLGTVPGVGGRLALSEGNILYSTAKSVFGGTDIPLGGVRTAALGNVAIIEGTDPGRVVVGEGPRAAEAFRLKFRVIPPDYEIQSSVIQYRVGNQTIGAPVPVTLANGRGELPLLFGFSFPKHPTTREIARPRIAINEGSPDELISGSKAWKLSPFEVLLAGQEDNDLEDDRTPPLVASTEEGHIGDVTASNEELQLRKETATGARPASDFALTWKQEGGILIFPDSQQQDDGHFETALVGRRVSGTSHWVQALKGDIVLGTSEPLPMLPGPAAKVSIVLPGAGPGTDGVVPADGTTEVPVVVEVRDANDNLVSDGTPVICAQGGDGELASESEVTTSGGFALCTYRADRMQSTIKLTAEVDGIEAETEITNNELQLSLAFSKPYVLVGEEMEVTLTATTAGGEKPANGTPVGWLVLGGRGTRDDVLTDGQARMRVRFDREDLVTVLAVVGGASTTGEILVVSAATELRVRQSAAVLAGDLTVDSLVPLPRFDGSTRDVPVKATNQVTISGGIPGETVRLALGTVDAPNRLPEAEYLMETLADGVMVDSYGRHSGQATGEVRVDTDGERRGYRFAGGVVSIPAAGPLAQPMGLAMGLAIKPEAPGVLLEREGSFSLALVDSGSGLRVRLTAVNGGVDRTIESEATVAVGSWTEVTARFAFGTMELQVAGEEQREIIGSLDAGAGDLRVGASFSGSVDELRLFHTSGASPPLLFVDDGSGVAKEEMEATFDASGQAFFSVRSGGVLDSLDQASALRPDGDTPLQSAIRAHIVGIQVTSRDGSRRSLATYLLGRELAAMVAVLYEAVAAGGSANTGLAVVVLDGILGFTPIGVITTVRDVTFALERVALGAATGWDIFTLTTVFLTLVFAAVISKRFVAADKAFEALQAWHRLRQRAQALPNLARWLRRAGADPVFAQRMKATLQILTQHGDDVTDAAIDVVKVAEKNWRHMVYLERTLVAAGDAAPDVIRALRQTLDSGAEVLQTTLAVTRTADKVTPKVVSAGRKIAKAVDAARKAGRAAPGTARYNAMLKTFLNPATREILEDIDDIADGSTQGLHLLVTQLGVPRAPFVYIADAAEAVVRYTAAKVKSLGKRVAAFERKVDVPVANSRQKKFFRQYDSSFDLGGGRFLDIDVKDWTSFAPRFKEALKLQKDIVIKFLNEGTYANLRWAIPSHLRGNRTAIEQWMLSQFNSRLVKSRIPDPGDLDDARDAFMTALRNGLIEFY